MKEEVGSWWKEPQKVKESCGAQENLCNAQDAPDDVQLAGITGEKTMTLQQRRKQLQEEEEAMEEEWLAWWMEQL
jgi:hypothetical protein